MQAFTFGQSKARITEPGDKNNKVTFKDVAGCKEAKEELKEIVGLFEKPEEIFRNRCTNSKGGYFDWCPRYRKDTCSRELWPERRVCRSFIYLDLNS
jgi:hypothetical protein